MTLGNGGGCGKRLSVENWKTGDKHQLRDTRYPFIMAMALYYNFKELSLILTATYLCIWCSIMETSVMFQINHT